MEYQKIVNLLDNTSNQPSKFMTRNWVEINDDSRGTYTNANTKFKSTMRKSNLCDYSDAYILVKGKKKSLDKTMLLLLLQDKQMKEIKV